MYMSGAMGDGAPYVCPEFLGVALGPGMGIPWYVRTTTTALNQGYIGV